MIAQLLAQATGQDAMIPGAWLLSVIPILFSGAALIVGRMHWKNQGAKEALGGGDVTLKKPVPTIETREKPIAALKADLDAHIARYDINIHNLHNRLDGQVKALARMEGTLESVKETSNTLLSLALGKKPPARP